VDGSNVRSWIENQERNMKSKRYSLQFVSGLAITLTLAVCAQAQTVSYLAKFGGKNGWEPFGSVVQATDGNFYGTTALGGNGHGNIFRMTPTGEITSIYSFCSQTNCTDGATPDTTPILGSDGNLYGVTLAGGDILAGGGGNGVFYRLTLAGQFTVLHDFCTADGCPDGGNPPGIMQASDGNFYGVALTGTGSDAGLIFKISPSGKFTTIHTFCSQTNCVDGSGGSAPPIQGRDGNFYGVTGGGGTEGGGVFYELTAAGSYQVLHNFCSPSSQCAEGSLPNQIVQDAKGNFFGTTIGGAAVFEITSTGEYKVLDNPVLPGNPGELQPLTLASDGNLYATSGGGNPLDGGDGLGTIFEISPAGKFTPLYLFCGCGNPASGYNPEGQLFQGTDGNFYGTTIFGGKSIEKFGTVFKLSKGLSPFVKTVPVAAKVGKQIIILGNNLSGTTGVMFNGVQANFTVESDSYIKATVPAGATTGTVSVVTPSGMLNSNPQFVVTK
jgi:uncharacterized repeat protein (TIGR03803 family)